VNEQAEVSVHDRTAASKALTARNEEGSRMVVDRHATGRCLRSGVGGGLGPRSRRARILVGDRDGKP
jgi:hypothetical protein